MELVANVDQWISQVTKANDGDNRDAANIAISVEGLADRTFHLYTHSLLDTTAKPAGNLGTWDFGISSGVLFKGEVTFTPTSNVFFSNSGDVTFASTPSFLAGLSATSGTVAISTTANLSGTTTLSGTTNLSGLTTIVGASNRMKLTARSVTRKLNLAKARFGIMFFDGTVGQSPLYNEATAAVLVKVDTSGSVTPLEVSFPVEIPHGCALNTISVTHTGDATVQFILRRNTTSIGAIGATTAAGTSAMSLGGVTIDNETNVYTLVMEVSTASGFKTRQLESVVLTYTVSEYDEG